MIKNDDCWSIYAGSPEQKTHFWSLKQHAESEKIETRDESKFASFSARVVRFGVKRTSKEHSKHISRSKHRVTADLDLDQSKQL